MKKRIQRRRKKSLLKLVKQWFNRIFCDHFDCSVAEIPPYNEGNHHLFCDKCGKDLGLIPPW